MQSQPFSDGAVKLSLFLQLCARGSELSLAPPWASGSEYSQYSQYSQYSWNGASGCRWSSANTFKADLGKASLSLQGKSCPGQLPLSRQTHGGGSGARPPAAQQSWWPHIFPLGTFGFTSPAVNQGQICCQRSVGDAPCHCGNRKW